jgi:small subunit ribosomal protein S17e
MGKKRTTSLRRIAEMLMEKNPEGFTLDFDVNKKLVSEMMNLPKLLRNSVAGYIIRLKRTQSNISILSTSQQTSESPRTQRRTRFQRKRRR